MKNLILLLTAAHVLAHGVFGCCGHGLWASAATEEHCVCHHGDDHHIDLAHDHHGHEAPLSEGWVDEDAPCSPHECVHASCHWMTGDLAASSLAMDAWMPLATFAILPVDPFSLRAAESSHFMTAASAAAPPLRLHLALGVMLV